MMLQVSIINYLRYHKYKFFEVLAVLVWGDRHQFGIGCKADTGPLSPSA